MYFALCPFESRRLRSFQDKGQRWVLRAPPRPAFPAFPTISPTLRSAHMLLPWMIVDGLDQLGDHLSASAVTCSCSRFGHGQCGRVADMNIDDPHGTLALQPPCRTQPDANGGQTCSGSKSDSGSACFRTGAASFLCLLAQHPAVAGPLLAFSRRLAGPECSLCLRCVHTWSPVRGSIPS